MNNQQLYFNIRFTCMKFRIHIKQVKRKQSCSWNFFYYSHRKQDEENEYTSI